jgi:hypothetical protein
MGVDFDLACADCCEFIDLHKWWVVDNACRFLIQAHFDTPQFSDLPPIERSLYPLVDQGSKCKKILVTAEQVEAAVNADIPNQPYIRELTPIVREFAARHRGHRLFLSCDLGDPEEEPWWPGRPGFADWLEVSGPFRFHQYLPRNLIEAAEFPTWAVVLASLGLEWPFVFAESHRVEIEAIRTAFEDRRTKCCT